MSKVIKAWVSNPLKNPFAKKTDASGITEITCSAPESCSLFTECKGCVLTGLIGQCRFGQKTYTRGPTRRARGFRSWISEKTEYCETINAEHGVKAVGATNRILLINGWYYLPYPHMSKGPFGLDNPPLQTPWMPEEALTAEVLEMICRGRPKNLFGDPLKAYQAEVLPKFLQDLQAFHPALFEMLPEDQKERAAGLSFVGRKADLQTVAPGPVEINKRVWQWDGTALTSTERFDAALKGSWEVKLTPEPGTEIVITRDEQVLPSTSLMD